MSEAEGLNRDEVTELMQSLLEATDGTRADDYAVLSETVQNSYDNVEKLTGRIEELEQQNGALRKENFKLFSRVGVVKEDKSDIIDSEIVGNSDEPDYLDELLDERGNWKREKIKRR